MKFAAMSCGVLLALTATALGDTAVDDAPDEDGVDAAAPAPVVAPRASPLPAPRPKLALEGGMLRLPGGTFTMGSSEASAPPNERPPHTETVAPFWLDKTEVTVSAYRGCVTAGKCPAPARTSDSCTYDAGDGELPVNCIHWAEAQAFCAASGKRLPREVEWEFAARGNAAAHYPWGGAATSCGLAVTLQSDRSARRCSPDRPARVGSRVAGASRFGVLDLSGNVQEWTSDWYSEHSVSGAAPRAGGSHVLRGGGWLSTPTAARVTSRDWASSMEAGPNVGFRCARD